MALHSTPYHERQGKFNQLCLVHALNMLVGEMIVSKETLNQVCDTLLLSSATGGSSSSSSWSWLNNPHKSSFFGGNYDVNVAMYVLQQEQDLDVSFFDGRKSAKELLGLLLCFGPEHGERDKPESSCLAADNKNKIVGLLVNVSGSWFLPGSRHWISYRPFHSRTWWKLDSKVSHAIEVPASLLLSTMEMHLNQKDQILIVTRKKE
jgi:Josephin